MWFFLQVLHLEKQSIHIKNKYIWPKSLIIFLHCWFLSFNKLKQRNCIFKSDVSIFPKTKNCLSFEVGNCLFNVHEMALKRGNIFKKICFFSIHTIFSVSVQTPFDK